MAVVGLLVIPDQEATGHLLLATLLVRGVGLLLLRGSSSIWMLPALYRAGFTGRLEVKQYSKDKNIRELVSILIKIGWKYKRRTKHGSITAPTGRMITIPTTPSDRRSFYNFRRDVNLALKEACDGVR